MKFSNVASLLMLFATFTTGHQLNGEGEKAGGKKSGKKMEGGEKDIGEDCGEKKGQPYHPYGGSYHEDYYGPYYYYEDYDEYHQPKYPYHHKEYYYEHHEEKCKCDGFEYFSVSPPDLATGDWGQALRAAAPNCVLAPVRSMEDIEGIRSAAQAYFHGTRLYVGIYKPLSEVSSTSGTASTSGWLNVDGSSVPDNPSFWATDKPDNAVPKEGYGVWIVGEGLDDEAEADPSNRDAIYLCCATASETNYCSNN